MCNVFRKVSILRVKSIQGRMGINAENFGEVFTTFNSKVSAYILLVFSLIHIRIQILKNIDCN